MFAFIAIVVAVVVGPFAAGREGRGFEYMSCDN